jgi:hypothetical protein
VIRLRAGAGTATVNDMRGPTMQERRNTLIVLLGLTAAAVCFGLLESSGEIHEPRLSLGGSFVGFIVTVLVLHRIWPNERATTEPKETDSDFLYDEVVKVLDFRGASSGGVILSDYYRVRRSGATDTISLHYATTGRIEDPVSITHPESAEWRETSVDHTGGDEHTLRHQYVFEVGLGELARGQATPVICQVTYRNAFLNTKEEWLETHVDVPTGRLGMIIIASSERRVQDAIAEVRIGRSPWRTVPLDPAVLQKGTMIYWSVDRPIRSAKYQVKWRWTEAM